MRDPKLGIPLAFILALGATESNGVASGLEDTAALLQPGSMRNLLAPDKVPLVGDRAIGEKDQHNSTGRIAQWFNGNFNSCFQGAWRRC
jgi:hypothetical protein